MKAHKKIKVCKKWGHVKHVKWRLVRHVKTASRPSLGTKRTKLFLAKFSVDFIVTANLIF